MADAPRTLGRRDLDGHRQRTCEDAYAVRPLITNDVDTELRVSGDGWRESRPIPLIESGPSNTPRTASELLIDAR